MTALLLLFRSVCVGVGGGEVSADGWLRWASHVYIMVYLTSYCVAVF